MIFGDEKRFYKDSKIGFALNNDSVLFGRTQTEPHLGPGAYYTAKNDDRRGRWSQRSDRPTSTFRSREPNHVIGSGLVVDDLYVHRLSSSGYEPGPGYYTPRQNSGISLKKGFSFNTSAEMQKVSKNMTLASSPGSPKSPRMTPVTATMRDDVLFYSTAHRQEIETGGPGYYYSSKESPLLKKSFNVRAGRKSQPSSPRSITGKASPRFAESTGFPFSPILKRPAGAFSTPGQH